MKKQVIQTLKMPLHTYENMIITHYVGWCAKRVKHPSGLQKLITCQPLFNWWLKELEKYELQFLKDVSEYNTAMSAYEALKLYLSYTDKINNRFSKPLLKYANESKSIKQ
ncbi:hypothetical protein [Pseudotamlana carrageenivorans]|uniref:Uncharacterized protein n=1 Tax=Pseudotamlana carrageenivorans TaxID=2069432 RepID=A0A2I7SKK5_9FLAO|nr:hypothetical protein [Tamlana carrageenivorans]AUS06455.1 hypothetical protein C1A40_13820 [Tamlana carrageenivorans]